MLILHEGQEEELVNQLLPNSLDCIRMDQMHCLLHFLMEERLESHVKITLLGQGEVYEVHPNELED